MLDAMNNQGLIIFTGFDHKTFNYILSKFKPCVDMFTPYKNNKHDHDIKIVSLTSLYGSKKGRKCCLTALMCLGLVLCWARTRGAPWNMFFKFGLVHSVGSIWL